MVARLIAATPAVGRMATLTAAIIAVLIQGCSPVPNYDQRGGPEIARQIEVAKAPWIEDVHYFSGDAIDPAYINIYVQHGVSEAEISEFACDVIHPIVAASDPPASLGISFVRDSAELATVSTIPC